MYKLSNLLIALLFVSSLQAQIPHLVFSQTQFGTLTRHLGDSIVIQDSMYNTSTTQIYHGSVILGARVNSNILPYNAIDSILFLNTTFDSLGGIKPCAIVLHIQNINFQVGPSAIVIWPIYNGGNAGPADSIRLTVLVVPLGIEESPLSKMYLFRGPNILNIGFGDAQKWIQQVRIYDMLGKTIYNDSAENSKHITTTGWQPGIYICELLSTQGERKTLRIRID